MKIFQCFLLFVMLALASVMADDDDNAECKHPCFRQPNKPLCAKAGGEAGSYFNQCEVDCDKAHVLHEGDCNFNDMLDNKANWA